MEEEYGIVDLESGDLVPRADRVLGPARKSLGDAVAPELNLCQIEVGTTVCSSMAEVRAELARLRARLVAAARQVGCGVVALGTHPFSPWQDQQVSSESDRFRRMEDTYRLVARQQVICGLHVHVGIDDPDLAVATMNLTRPWLPVLLALSANSPFWQGEDSGYSSYRTQVWQRWPTSGMPPELPSAAAYDDLVGGLQTVEAIEEPSYLYWYVRPSSRYPTLEFRACDTCLLAADAVTLAGLIRALAWTCMQRAIEGAPAGTLSGPVLDAAMWRAARYGLDDSLVSPSAAATRPAQAVVEELLDHVRDGLEEHGDMSEVHQGIATILRRGNGATRQRAVLASHGEPRAVVTDALAATAVAP
ncbi:MAG: carboxylate-amine ligase [Acidimicrobiales bacterium]